MTTIRCRKPKCNKVVGELEYGKGRYVCPKCGTVTVVTIEPAPQAAESTGMPVVTTKEGQRV